MIDPADVGAVGAAVLTGDGHEGRTYALTGPEALTYTRVAEELSAATGREIRFVDVPEDAARRELEASGAPPWLVSHLTQLFALVRQGALEEVTIGVHDLLGHEPRGFGEFAREHAAIFAA